MKESELREQYTQAMKILGREKHMRMRVYPPGHLQHTARVGEIEAIMQTLTAWKDELKAHCEPEYSQATLLDVPQKKGAY